MNLTPQTQPKQEQQTPVPPTWSKNDILETTIRWINHKEKLYASSAAYRQELQNSNHLREARQLKKWAHKIGPHINIYSVASFIIINDKHLEGIMPHPYNDSHTSQKEMLENILNACREVCK